MVAFGGLGQDSAAEMDEEPEGSDECQKIGKIGGRHLLVHETVQFGQTSVETNTYYCL